jgi:uncharacterized protein YuzE
MVKQRFLEVTYRQGKPIAAYLYLPRKADDFASRTTKFQEGLLIDFAADGRAIGIEIASPGRIHLDLVNQALASIQQDPIKPGEFAPLAAA